MKFWDIVTVRKLEKTWLRSAIVGIELFGIVSVFLFALRNPKFCEFLSIAASVSLVAGIFWLLGWLVVEWRQDRERW